VSRYRLAYDPVATSVLAAMDAATRGRFENDMAWVADDPYARSTAIRVSEPDRREVTAGGCFAVLWVSSSVVTVTVVRIQTPP